MLAEKQRVEECLALLAQANSKCALPYRVDNHGRCDTPNIVPQIEQAEMEIAIFPPSSREPLIEAANCQQHVAAAETVRRQKLTILQAGDVSLIVGGTRRQRHDGLTRHRDYG